jgi:hypothetical protein
MRGVMHLGAFPPAKPLSNTVLMEIPNQQGRRIG